MKSKVLPVFAAVALAGCGEAARLPEQASMGPTPRLAEPEHRLLPTVNIADIERWPQGKQPQAPQGWRVTAFAQDLTHPRWLCVLPNGDVLVAETNKPADSPPEPQKIRGFMFKFLEKKA